MISNVGCDYRLALNHVDAWGEPSWHVQSPSRQGEIFRQGHWSNSRDFGEFEFRIDRSNHMDVKSSWICGNVLVNDLIATGSQSCTHPWRPNRLSELNSSFPDTRKQTTSTDVSTEVDPESVDQRIAPLIRMGQYVRANILVAFRSRGWIPQSRSVGFLPIPRSLPLRPCLPSLPSGNIIHLTGISIFLVDLGDVALCV